MDVFWSPKWPTRDHVIPYKLFFCLMHAMTNVAAAERYELVQGVAHGHVLATNPKDSTQRSAMRALIDRGFPEVELT